MAVYERKHRSYDGPRTPLRSRFLVVARYASADVFRSRIFTGFFFLCFSPVLTAGATIYFVNNLGLFEQIGLELASSPIAIDATYFYWLAKIQSGLGTLIALVVGPSLLIGDLSNNALPMYLARPLTRTHYVAGKLLVLVVLLSLVTWVPDLMLYLLQGFLAGDGWLLANLRIAFGLLVGSALWILQLSLLTLVLAAWARWKLVARAMLIGVYVLLAALAATLNNLFKTHWGSLIDLEAMTERTLAALMGAPVDSALSGWAAGLSLVAAMALWCWLLARRIRPLEVVR